MIKAYHLMISHLSLAVLRFKHKLPKLCLTSQPVMICMSSLSISIASTNLSPYWTRPTSTFQVPTHRVLQPFHTNLLSRNLITLRASLPKDYESEQEKSVSNKSNRSGITRLATVAESFPKIAQKRWLVSRLIALALIKIKPLLSLWKLKCAAVTALLHLTRSSAQSSCLISLPLESRLWWTCP